MNRVLRWAVALLALLALTLGAAAEGLDAPDVEIGGTAEAALTEALAEGVDPLAEEIEMTLDDDGEDDPQAAPPAAEDAPVLEIEPEAVETPAGEPEAAQAGETPAVEPETAQAGETPAVEPEAAQAVETPASEPEAAQAGETPASEPEAAQAGETPAVEPEAAQAVETPAGEPEAAQAVETPASEPEAAQTGETIESESEATQSGETPAGEPEAAQAVAAPEIIAEAQAPAAVPATIVLGVREQYAIPGMEGAAFASSNKKIATVTAAGVVRGKKKGRTTVVAVRGAETVEYAVQVKAAPKKISFSNKKLTLSYDAGQNLGEQRALNPKLTKGSSSRISYIGYDPRIVTVSEDGTVTAVGVGTTRVTARTYNNKKAKITVRVKPAQGSASAETPTPIVTSLAMGRGETSFPLLGAADVNTVCGGVTFTSTNKKVATVNAQGAVKAKKKGKATIRIDGANGGSAKVTIRVRKAPTKVTLSPKTLTLDQFAGAQLTARLPKGQAGMVTYASSNEAVAQVDAAGYVTAVGMGSAVITARTYNGKKAKCTVEVASVSLEIRMADVARCSTGRTTVFPIEVVTPAGANYSGPVYVTIEPGDVAAYDNGKIQGLRGGQTAQLTVTAGGATRSCAVIVEDSANARPVAAIAHRGSVHWPENTLEAFRFFPTTGADAAELDVRATSDGVQVVLHDASYYSNGVQHDVVKETYETVKALYPSMCTLDEALDELAKSDRDIYLNPKETADGAKCALAVRARGLQSRTVYFSGTDQVLQQIYNVDSSAALGYSLASGSASTGQELESRVRGLHVGSIMLNKNLVSQQVIDYWHGLGFKVYVWTVNDKDVMRTLCDMGADGIITDYPEYCVEARAKG